MLTHLHIRNFAIVDALELEFKEGMSVLTGETGAGKSILLDALGLCLGDRADSMTVRTGTDRAEVTAAFMVDKMGGVRAWLEANELEVEEECLIRRTVGSDGRSKAYVNGQMVPVGTLRQLGEQLVDIHGQHAHQSLLRRDAQRQLLDQFAGHADQVEELGVLFRRWRELRDEYERLSRVQSERDARLDLLRFQVGELQALGLQPGEIPQLEEEHHRLANASRLLEGTQLVEQLLYDEEHSASSLLSRVLNELRDLERYDTALGASSQMVESALIQAREAASELRHYCDRLDLDPARLGELEQRLGDIHTLSRKHRVEGEELVAVLGSLEEELASLENAGARLEGLEKEIAAAWESYLGLARRVSKGRAVAGEKLSVQVTANMQELGMANGRFEASTLPLSEQEATAAGLERIEFLVSANPGMPLRPLGKVASGGELSRISLAIQVIAAGDGGIPTLIFDEVDVGVGGGVAEMVGRRLRALGHGRQVICVTHQPQVAALGHHHFQVSKAAKEGATTTCILPLTPAERIDEVARMLGGLEITAQTRSHAQEMLERAS